MRAPEIPKETGANCYRWAEHLRSSDRSRHYGPQCEPRVRVFGVKAEEIEV